jgi:hypothetical protein
MSDFVSAAVTGARYSSRDVFQWLSYLQYPAMLAALAYAVKSSMTLVSIEKGNFAAVYDDWNYILLYAGVGIGLSSLQDPSKTQNKASLKVWQDPRKGRWFLVLIGVYAFSAIILGLIGAYLANDNAVNQLSLGLVAFGLGMIGLLKTATEMREHHRLDKQPVSVMHRGQA